ncbi:uncharacterized protein METZ01_LOCUS399967 [marine metagenome]|uniref:Uncharacterized protein n=1 Tax=marine metagenome TaxID=408172 RepID=A0A382VKV3_9ZZZZ
MEAIVNLSCRLRLFKTATFNNRNKVIDVLSVAKIRIL